MNAVVALFKAGISYYLFIRSNRGMLQFSMRKEEISGQNMHKNKQMFNFIAEAKKAVNNHRKSSE